MPSFSELKASYRCHLINSFNIVEKGVVPGIIYYHFMDSEMGPRDFSETDHDYDSKRSPKVFESISRVFILNALFMSL